MGYIKEPDGVDIFIKSEPLDDKARKEISKALKAYRAQQDKIGQKAGTPLKIKNGTTRHVK